MNAPTEAARKSVIRTLALDINTTINRNVRVSGTPVTGGMVTEALLLCITARMTEAVRTGMTTLPWQARRDAIVELFDLLSQEMEGR